MPFLIRPSRRFPVCCPITYQCGDFEGHGTVWNVSLTGWRLSGDLPMRPALCFPQSPSRIRHSASVRSPLDGFWASQGGVVMQIRIDAVITTTRTATG
jgi:hypothetical protein